MSAHENLSPQQFFHATPHNLDDQEHLLPPAATGREPNWEGMHESEHDKVFMTDSVDSARGWGADIAGERGDPFHVYQVHPEAPQQGGPPGMYTASRARMGKRVFSYIPDDDPQ